MASTRTTVVGRIQMDPQELAEACVCLGFSVALAMYERGRDDIMKTIDTNLPFQQSMAKAVVASWLSEAMADKGNAELAKSFAALIDGVIKRAEGL